MMVKSTTCYMYNRLHTNK